jgi:hypothetical protein
MVSQRQSLFFLANQDIAEPRDFKFRVRTRYTARSIFAQTNLIIGG